MHLKHVYRKTLPLFDSSREYEPINTKNDHFYFLNVAN